MDEFGLIRQYFAAAPCAQAATGVVLGIGDDCALLQLAAGEQLAISTDTLVAGVHFPDPCDAYLLGQRSLAVAASDLAAMGATPLGFTLALSLPAATAEWLQGFAAGLNKMAQDCGLALIGGDTTRGPLSVTVTVFGRLPVGQALLRSGAQRQVAAELAAPLLARYWSPQPQLALGQALRGKATAALDISDGLLADCGHIAKASGVALQIELERLPLSPALLALLDKPAAQDCALSGGDDYRLAFTLPALHLPALRAAGWPLVQIGQVVAGCGVHLLDAQGETIHPRARGYQHFGSSSD
jgi:thiamine-monophosphate kinase